jgi:hypothetical protein
MRFFSALEAKTSFAFVALGNTASISKNATRTRSESDLFTSGTRAPTCHAIGFNERSQLVTFKLGKEIRRSTRNFLFCDELVAPCLGASFPDAKRPFIEGITNITIPARFTELVSTRHTDHFVRIEAIFIKANFTMLAFR